MLDINEGNFEKEVVKSNLPVIVDFWALWCKPCMSITPILEKISGEYEDRLKFAKANIEESKNLGEKCGIIGIPCLVFFQDGAEKHRVTGFKSENDLIEN